jgi:predicted lysophospholipase L1 biosynthesis ABC-type transport system permease subunit
VAILTALLAMAVTIAGGLAVTWRALSVKPAPILRNE